MMLSSLPTLLLGTLSLWTVAALGQGMDIKGLCCLHDESWSGGVHAWMCKGGPMLTPRAKLDCRGDKIDKCWESDFCKFRLGLNLKLASTNDTDTSAATLANLPPPLFGEHSCWRDKPGEPPRPDGITCTIEEEVLVCSYKSHKSNPHELGNLPQQIAKDFYKKVVGREYDPKDPPCPTPGPCCRIYALEWEDGVHDWMCEGGPMITRKARANCKKSDYVEQCDSGRCELSLSSHVETSSPPGAPGQISTYPIYGDLGCWRDPEDGDNGKSISFEDKNEDDETTCKIIEPDGPYTPGLVVRCSYKSLPDPSALGNVPLKNAKDFYKGVKGREYDPQDPPCLYTVSCYGGAGLWKSLREWECQGGPLQPPKGKSVDDAAVVYLVTCDDEARYVKGFCSFDITPRSAEGGNEEMNVHFWCLEKRDFKTPRATSATPVCTLQNDTDGRPIPSLRCSYQPGKDPKVFERAAVSKRDLKLFKDAVYKAKLWPKDKWDKVKCSGGGGRSDL